MDMLSKLPDPIFCLILSFVPTKTSVACSVLSKRWKLLWTSVPVLDFDENRDMPPNLRPSYDRKEQLQLRFVEIVDKLYFGHREFPVKILRLSIRINESCECKNYLHKWIKAWRFEELDLSVGCRLILTFPKSSHYSNMAVLKLNGSNLGSVESGLFPKLRVLNLSWVFFLESGASLENFLSACPVLEELECNELRDHRTFRICVPTLTSLVLECWEHYSHSEFVLETPALEYLSFKHNATQDSLVKPSLCNLSRAYITCLVQTNYCTNYGYGSFVMKLLNNLSCVKFLKLSFEKTGSRNDDCWAALRGLVNKFDYSCLDDLPVFHNLVRLELRIPSCDCVLLPHLLQQFHNLKHMSIHKICDIEGEGEGEGEGDGDEVCWKEPHQVPICLSSTLSSFYFHGFEGFEVEVELVKYVTKHAKVLNNMTLKTSKYFKAFESRAEATYKLPMVTRGSDMCQFHISSETSDQGSSGSVGENNLQYLDDIDQVRPPVS